MYSDIFPDCIIATNDEPAFLPVKFQILGDVTEGCEWIYLAIGPNYGAAINHHMGMELAAIAQLHIGANNAKRADLNSGPQFCIWVYYRTRMYVAH
jgi:hypothetical protein